MVTCIKNWPPYESNLYESKFLIEWPVQAMHLAKKRIRIQKFQRVIFQRQIRVSFGPSLTSAGIHGPPERTVWSARTNFSVRGSLDLSIDCHLMVISDLHSQNRLYQSRIGKVYEFNST